MQTITLLQEKGGVGKTTCAITLAAGLAIKGYRVLVIDADGQAHATRAFGVAPEPGLYQIVVRDADWRDHLKVINPMVYNPGADKSGVMLLLPGNHESMVISQLVQDSFAIQRRLIEIEAEFDYAIIDTSPTPSLLNGSILLATDGVIFPTEMEYFSMKALESSLSNAQRFGEQRRDHGLPGLAQLGIIPTMTRRCVEHEENLNALIKKHGAMIWPSLPQRVAWPESAMRRQSIFVYDRNSASHEAWSIVDKFLEVADVR